MSVIYKGEKPKRNYSLQDFYSHGILLWWIAKFKSGNENIPSLRIIFRSNGLLGEIRTTCYGDTYAVDVKWGWWSDKQRCLTTECKSLREAKSILFTWFESMGFNRTEEQIRSEQYAQSLSLKNVQLHFNPLFLNALST